VWVLLVLNLVDVLLEFHELIKRATEVRWITGELHHAFGTESARVLL